MERARFGILAVERMGELDRALRWVSWSCFCPCFFAAKRTGSHRILFILVLLLKNQTWSCMEFLV